MNSRFVEMTRIPQQDMLGADASEFYSEQEWAFLAQQIAVVRHQGRHRYEFLLPQKDGGRLPVIISSRILQNSGGEFRIITASDISEEGTSDSLEVELEPDDRVVLYTDGITDVFNSSGEMLGVEGVREIVREAASLPAEEMKQGILDGVVAWRNGPPTDDASLVLAHVR